MHQKYTGFQAFSGDIKRERQPNIYINLIQANIPFYTPRKHKKAYNFRGVFRTQSNIFKGNPNYPKHIKLNHTSIALLLQEATQKYQKLTYYWTKSCYLSLPFSLFTTTCASFAFLAVEFFQFFKHRKWSFVKYIVSFFDPKMVFSKLSLANYHFLHK